MTYLTLIKLNNDEVAIKGRRYADGRNHQNWLFKEDTLSPIMYTDGLMISCIIDTMEGWDGAAADIPGNFLKIIATKETYIST